MQQLPEDQPEKSAVWRIFSGTASGYGMGTILGAITANWSDVPTVLRNKQWAALKRTGEM